MDKPVPNIDCKSPADFSQEEKDAFCALVIKGGEVSPGNARAGVKRAERLAFARAGNTLAGAGCLKNPHEAYRGKVFRKSGSSLNPDSFKFEVGYIFVDEDFRGQKLSTRLVGELISGVEAKLFATSHDHEDKYPMHAALRRHGFRQEGDAYESDTGQSKMLLLFVRNG